MIHQGPAEGIPDLNWFKSSYSSGSEGDSCVEVADGPSVVHIRDSKDLTRCHFEIDHAGWRRFVRFAAER